MASKFKLSVKSERLVESLCVDAMDHGWQQDQGTGRAVDRAETAYQESRKALQRHIARLERELAANKTLIKTMREKLHGPYLPTGVE